MYPMPNLCPIPDTLLKSHTNQKWTGNNNSKQFDYERTLERYETSTEMAQQRAGTIKLCLFICICVCVHTIINGAEEIK